MLPVFLATIFIIMEASLWVYSSSVAQAAAQDGARAATAFPGNPDDGVVVAERILDARASGTGWKVTSVIDGESFTVTVTGYAPSIVPGLEFAVRESASLPWEGR